MSISLANPSIDQDSSGEFMPDSSVGGRISRCADQILCFAPFVLRDLKVSVSSFALGSVVATSLMGGGSIHSAVYIR